MACPKRAACCSIYSSKNETALRTFYTLLLIVACAHLYGQLSLPKPKFLEHPTFVNHIGHFGQPESLTRGAGGVCDSNDLLDYSSYTEVYSLLNGAATSSIYGFNGVSTNPLYIQEIK